MTLPNLPSIYGAMLAGVDYVIMGAGIPRDIPAVLDAFSKGEKASIRVNVSGAEKDEEFRMYLDPKDIMGEQLTEIPRPKFYAIVSSNILATTMVKKTKPPVDGLVIEHNTAGGHNAPPRGGLNLGETGEPTYGDKDEVDLAKIKALNVPFWLAGSWGEACKLKEAVAAGAQGIQIELCSLCAKNLVSSTVLKRLSLKSFQKYSQTRKLRRQVSRSRLLILRALSQPLKPI